MRKISIIFLFCLLSFTMVGQRCYEDKTKDYIEVDFSNIWTERTFQGTIGEKNQRIEIRFTHIKKVSDSKTNYNVIGKSKVNDNICDFQGKFSIEKIYDRNFEKDDCENHDSPNGYIIGTYELQENPNQKHVGIFKGKFKMDYDWLANEKVQNIEYFSINGSNSFIGIWTEYKKQSEKYCSWGQILPPTKHNDLIKNYNEGYYLFNPKYLNKGWQSYVLSVLNTLMVVPKDFNAMTFKHPQDFIIFSEEEIAESYTLERRKWWK